MRRVNVSCNEIIFARVVWHIDRSCWNHITSQPYSSIAGKKKSVIVWNYAARKCLLQKSHIRTSCVACPTVLLKPHILQVVFFNSSQKSRLSYNHNAPNWRWQSFHRRFRRSKVQSHLWTKERTQQWIFLDVMASLLITWGFSEPQIWQFCFLTYPSSGKWVSLLKKIVFEKLTCCSSTHSSYLGRCEWSAGFSCCVWWTLGVDLNAKYVIMRNVP